MALAPIAGAVDPRQNLLLRLLPEELLAEIELIHLELGKVVYESGRRQAFVYFPIDCIISMLYVTEDGSSTEIALAGNEGLVGLALFMGGDSMPSRTVVQSAGFAYRMPAKVLKREFERGGPLQIVLLRYTQALIAQMTQTAVCNRHHDIQQQLCRWLLMSLDRLRSNDLVMTQELIANMLGVRREGVTVAAGKLQRLGAIDYHRGHIKVLDRVKLESVACECYEVVKREYLRLFPPGGYVGSV